MPQLRLAFMGTPEFATKSLNALCEVGHDVVVVYTQPPRPAGRGKHVQPSPVQLAAEQRGLQVQIPKNLKQACVQEQFAAFMLDAAVIVSYGLLLPVSILNAPRLGCINVHASLLPRWRGAAPIQRAMLAGDYKTGITIMQMDEGLDTGPILLTESIPIGTDVTITRLHKQLSDLGARLIVKTLDQLAVGSLLPNPQPEYGITYASKLSSCDGWLDWHDASYAMRQVRALTPSPGVWFDYRGERLKVWAAELVTNLDIPTDTHPGTVLDNQLTIACAKKTALRITKLQRPGKLPVLASSFLRGFSIPAGTRL